MNNHTVINYGKPLGVRGAKSTPSSMIVIIFSGPFERPGITISGYIMTFHQKRTEHGDEMM